MTKSKLARATETSGAPPIRINSHRVLALAEAGARGHALSPVEVRAVCEAFRAQGQRVPTQFHSGV